MSPSAGSGVGTPTDAPTPPAPVTVAVTRRVAPEDEALVAAWAQAGTSLAARLLRQGVDDVLDRARILAACEMLGMAQQVVRGVGRIGEQGHADAAGQRELRAFDLVGRLGGAQHAARRMLGRLGAGMVQQHRELVAAQKRALAE